jgi:hypothetical protein
MSHVAGSQLNPHPGPEKNASPVAAKPRRLIVRTCKHFMESGAFCQSPAAGKSAYCRAHKQLRVRLARMARARREAGVLKLPPAVDLQAVQTSLERIRIALALDRIDPVKARLLRWAMRQAASNLRSIERRERLARRGDALQTDRPGRIAAGMAREPKRQVVNPIP